MTLFWRLFLAIFVALLLTAAAMAFITHKLREIPSSDIDPGGAAALGRLASSVDQVLARDGLEGVKRMDRRRFRPVLFELDGQALIRAPHFVDKIAETAQADRPKVWINEGQVLLGPALVSYQDRELHLFVLSRAPRGSQPPAPYKSFIAIGTLIALVLAFVVSRIAAMRVSELKQWSRELAVDVQAPAPTNLVKRRDEFGDLTRSFVGMADQIQGQLEAQRALTRMISHEVRSPLTRLKLVLDLMERSDDARELLPRAHSQIHALDGLLEQMLMLSRLEANAWALEGQQDHWSARFETWASEWQEQAQEAGVELEYSIAPDLTFDGDEALMHIAIDNLIRNSISLSEPEQRIRLSIEPGLRLVVQDQAGGLDEDQLERVMEPFEQGARASGSTGLGLAIVSQIARVHRGQLTLTNAEGGLRAELVLAGLAG